MPTTRIPYGVLDGRYVNTAGDTMLGELTLAGAPTLDLHASTKKYVDDAVGVGGHTHTLDAGATDVTATAAEVNLLDLSGLSVGQVLRAIGDSSASWGSIQSGDLPAGIDAAKIADGSVSNTEYQYLNGVTSAIQTQLDAKAADSIVLKKDGSVALTANWDIGDTRKILADGIRARDAAGLELYDDEGNGIFVENGGEVGIGITSPLTTLHVNGNFGLGNSITSARLNDEGGPRVFSLIDTNSVIRLWRYYSSGAAIEFITGTNDDIASSANGWWDMALADTGSAARFFFRERTGGSTQSHMTIKSGGNIGIGTSSPSQALEVAGSAVIGAHDSYHRLYVSRFSSSGYSFIAAGDIDRDMGVGLAFQYRNANGSLATGLTIDVDGKLGIGIAPPAGPARRLEIIDPSASQLRLTQLADTNYVDFLANVSGDLTITPSGSKIVMAKALEVDGAFDHDGPTFGVFGATPASLVAPYTVTNAITDRSFDADSTTIAELADVVATIINDLKTYGFFQ